MYSESALIYIGAKASVVFMNNSAGSNNRVTSTLFMKGNGPMIYIGIRAKVVFIYNTSVYLRPGSERLARARRTVSYRVYHSWLRSISACTVTSYSIEHVQATYG